MREKFDPNFDCVPAQNATAHSYNLYQIDGGKVGPLFVWEAVQILYAVAYAYDVFHNKGGDYGALLSDISRQLADMNRKLDDIQRDIKTVIAKIDALPTLLRGQVDESNMMSALWEAQGYAADLQFKTAPDKIADYLGSIEIELPLLYAKFNSARMVGGFKGLIMGLPHYMTWLNAWVAFEKTKQKIAAEKNQVYSPHSPWDHPGVGYVKSQVSSLYDFIVSEDHAAEGEITSLVKHKMHFVIENMKHRPVFCDTVSGKPGPFERGFHLELYFLFCPDPASKAPERLRYRVWDKSFQPGADWVMTHDWQDIQPGTMADNFWAIQKAKRQDVATFYDLVWPVWNKQSDVMATFVEPPNLFPKPLIKEKL